MEIEEIQKILENKECLQEDVTRLGSILYNHLQDQIFMADNKAHLILAANAFLAAAATGLSHGMFIRLMSRNSLLVNLSGFFCLIMFICLIISFYYILMVTRPILKVTDNDLKNLFYFGGIKNYQKEEFVETFLAQGQEKLKYEMFLQVSAKVNIAYKKFERIQKAMKYLTISVIIWACTCLILTLVPK